MQELPDHIQDGVKHTMRGIQSCAATTNRNCTSQWQNLMLRMVEAQTIEGVISKWGGVIRTICWEAGWIATLFLELGNIDIFLVPSESWLLKQQCCSNLKMPSPRELHTWSGESVDLQQDLMVQNVTVNKNNEHRESVLNLGQEVWLIFRSRQLRRWQCRAWARAPAEAEKAAPWNGV